MINFSAAILLSIAKEVAEKTITLNRKVSLLFTVYEEVGHGGSSIPADTEEMICVDMAVSVMIWVVPSAWYPSVQRIPVDLTTMIW